MIDYIKEMGFVNFTLMMFGAVVVDLLFIAMLWIIPQGDRMSDYENYDNLAFEPKLTWEELCEYAESKGAWIGDGYFVFICLNFFEEGNIKFSDEYDVSYYIAVKRTYEQMKTIIDALWGQRCQIN